MDSASKSSHTAFTDNENERLYFVKTLLPNASLIWFKFVSNFSSKKVEFREKKTSQSRSIAESATTSSFSIAFPLMRGTSKNADHKTKGSGKFYEKFH